MKLVQLLAKELKEWPVKEGEYNKESDYCVQSDQTSQVFFCGSHGEIFLSERADETSGVRVTRSEWQAEREKMNKPKWIRHRGGKCPVPYGTKVETRHRDGYTCSPHFYTQNASSSSSDAGMNLVWSHKGDKMDIMAYRVIEETKDQEIEEVRKFSKDVDMNIGQGEIIHGPVSIGDTVIAAAHPKFDTNLGTLTYKLEIDAIEATQQIDSLVEKWGQIESPLKWRDEIIELEAYEEEFRREREKLIRKLESEGFKLIDQINCNLDKIDQTLESSVDMSDWRNWKTGDVIEIVANEGGHQFENGEEVIVVFLDIEDAEMNVKAEYKDGSDYWWLSGTDAKFIRRP